MLRLIIYIFLLHNLVVFGQKSNAVKKAENFITNHPPPNGIQIGDRIYMDETEIANIHYLEYLFRLKKDSSELVYNQALPYHHALTWSAIPRDSLNVLKQYQEDQYLRNPTFRFFPVVGITKNQAIEYAHWRSKIVSQTINDKLKEEKKTFRLYYKFRLIDI